MKSTENQTVVANPPAVNRRNQRRNYIINPAFQWKYATTIALAVFLISSLMGSVLYLLLHQQARARLVNPESYAAEVTSVILLFAVGLSAVAAAGVGLWCVIASHRICGPLFVLERYLVELAEGRLPKPRPLRRKDQFKHFYAVFSSTIESLKVGKERELAVLTESLEITRSAMEGDDDARRSALDSVAGRLETLHKAANKALGNKTDRVPAAPVVQTRVRAGRRPADGNAAVVRSST